MCGDAEGERIIILNEVNEDIFRETVDLKYSI